MSAEKVEQPKVGELPPLDVTASDIERPLLRASRDTWGAPIRDIYFAVEADPLFEKLERQLLAEQQVSAGLKEEVTAHKEQESILLERVELLTGEANRACDLGLELGRRAEAAEASLAEMTKNRDLWERNSAAENRRAGDALVEVASLTASLVEARETLLGWLKANGPVGWIDDLRKQVAVLKAQEAPEKAWERGYSKGYADALIDGISEFASYIPPYIQPSSKE